MEWSELVGSLLGCRFSVRNCNNTLYVSGDFTTAGGISALNIAKITTSIYVTGSFIQDGTSYTSLTFTSSGSSAVLNYDTFESKWAIITTSPYTIMA